MIFYILYYITEKKSKLPFVHALHDCVESKYQESESEYGNLFILLETHSKGEISHLQLIG